MHTLQWFSLGCPSTPGCYSLFSNVFHLTSGVLVGFESKSGQSWNNPVGRQVQFRTKGSVHQGCKAFCYSTAGMQASNRNPKIKHTGVAACSASSFSWQTCSRYNFRTASSISVTSNSALCLLCLTCVHFILVLQNAPVPQKSNCIILIALWNRGFSSIDYGTALKTSQFYDTNLLNPTWEASKWIVSVQGKFARCILSSIKGYHTARDLRGCFKPGIRLHMTKLACLSKSTSCSTVHTNNTTIKSSNACRCFVIWFGLSTGGSCYMQGNHH